MKVGQGPIYLHRVAQAYERPAALAGAGRGRRGDLLEISSLARRVPELTQQTMDIPDVREGKIQDISARMRRGDYQVSLDDLADSILQELKAC